MSAAPQTEEEFPTGPCEGFFQVNFPDEYFLVATELLVKSRLLQPFVELAQLDDSQPIEVRNQININNDYPREFHNALTLISQLMDNPYLCFQNGMSSNELAHLLRISEHFQFTELSEQVMIVLARRLEDAAVDGKLCEALGVPMDMTEEQRKEAERHCNIFKELEES